MATSITAEEAPTWPQWGGPTGDFQAPAQDLADRWPEAGPERLWRRELGDGYSAILFENTRLYTMHRTDDLEAVICLDAETGKTLWEQRYPAPFEGLRGYGLGPRSTPAVAGETLVSIGITGKMTALHKRDGRVLWSRDLDQLRSKYLGHGYSSSPVVWKDTVIASVGGKDSSLVAFDLETGDVKWQAHSFARSQSSPRIVELAGEQQVVAFMAQELIGLDPDTGALLWRYSHGNQWGHNITMPLVLDSNGVSAKGSTVFLSSPQAGARGLELARDGESLRLDELWSTRRIQFYHASVASIGDWVYGSTGVTSPAFMTAVNVRTGEIGWRQRGFAKANTVAADGKLVILDEDGVLYLAKATPEELVVLARTQLLGKVAWTVPTIVGKTLYARDRKQILAVNLGQARKEIVAP